ncbi:hypothetical protein SAMN05428981_101227 [Bacillus sp. OV194]|nr:hypothetical protein SAMN05428981_101227 [Bacillus sp. OV194]
MCGVYFMFISYCDASILDGHHFIGCIIKTKHDIHTKRAEIAEIHEKSRFLTINILEFYAFEFLVKEIYQLQLYDGVIYFDSNFANRSLTGQSDWFKKRSGILLLLMKKKKIKFECISSKDNLAHDIARGFNDLLKIEFH